MNNEKTVIISLGGSLIVPDQIDWEFVSRFKAMIEKEIAAGYKFIIIAGGGRIARKYQEAASEVTDLSKEDRDWLGIHATRLNAHFLRTVFSKHAHPRINKNPHDLEDFYISQSPILIAAGWRPGNSTDLIAVILAKYLGIRRIANLSNIDYVYDKDPRKFPDAEKIEKLSWDDFRKIVGDNWDPGMNAPFDPVASKMAQGEGMEVAIMNGKTLENLKSYIEGSPFRGTMIS